MSLLQAHADRDLSLTPVEAGAWHALEGLPEVKSVLERRVMLPFSEPAVAERHGVCPPTAVLLFGPPGTGKSVLARAVAERLGWALAEPELPPLVGSAARLRELFERILALDAVVIFLDEFEQLGLRRDGSASPNEPSTAELLRGLSALRGNGRVMVVCATNHVRLLDPAVLRPGRFDLVLPVGPPDAVGRRRVLQALLAGRACGPVDVATVAERSSGLTAADLELVCERAARAAFEREVGGGRESRIETADLVQSLNGCRPTLDPNDAAAFREDVERYARY